VATYYNHFGDIYYILDLDNRTRTFKRSDVYASTETFDDLLDDIQHMIGSTITKSVSDLYLLETGDICKSANILSAVYNMAQDGVEWNRMPKDYIFGTWMMECYDFDIEHCTDSTIREFSGITFRRNDDSETYFSNFLYSMYAESYSYKNECVRRCTAEVNTYFRRQRSVNDELSSPSSCDTTEVIGTESIEREEREEGEITDDSMPDLISDDECDECSSTASLQEQPTLEDAAAQFQEMSLLLQQYYTNRRNNSRQEKQIIINEDESPVKSAESSN
jgi:hypothetical protein